MTFPVEMKQIKVLLFKPSTGVKDMFGFWEETD